MALIDYGSSEDEDDIQPEKPSKIAKTETAIPTPKKDVAESESSRILDTNSTDLISPAQPSQPPVQDEIPPSIEASGPAPGPSILVQATSEDVTRETTPFSPYTYERNRLRELTMPTVPNFDIPDSPPPPTANSEEAAVLAATTKKIERFLELKKKGVHFNERLQNSTSLRNPSLLPKLMQFANITQEDSYRSSLPEGLSVPVSWPEDCYVENLMKQNERKQKKRLAERDKVEFVPAAGTRDETSGQKKRAAGSSGGQDGAKKSRFDR